MEIVLQREPRFNRTRFHAGLILLNEGTADASICELIEKTLLTLTIGDLTRLRNNHVRVQLHAGKLKLVYVFAASVPVPYA
jgi:hypothetical protein